MFKATFKIVSVAAACFLAAAAANAEATAAAAIDVKACYQTVIKKCCDVAPDVELTKECSDGETSWVCIGRVFKNPLVNTTTRSTEGLQFSTTSGTADCEYQKPECGSFRGSCTYAADNSLATCDIKTATGAACVSPQLFAEDGVDGLELEKASECHNM